MSIWRLPSNKILIILLLFISIFFTSSVFANDKVKILKMKEETLYIDTGWYLKNMVLQIQNLDSQMVNVTYSLEQQDSDSGKWVPQEKTFKLEARETKEISLAGTVIDDTEKWRGAYNAEDGTPIGRRIETPIRNFKIKSVSPAVVDEVPSSESSGNSGANSDQKGMANSSGNGTVKVDKYGLVEEPILDPEMNARLDEELAAAAKGRDYLDRKREEDFEKIRHEKIEEWKQNLRDNKASFEDHPDVQMMSVLSGADGILMAPSVAKEFDQALMDKGWYPYVKSGDVNDIRYERSNRSNYDKKVGRPEGIPRGIVIPTFNSIKDYYLDMKEK